ncbi:Full equals Chorismatase [Streptomyces rapamycinicus NRRL 5491]|uniref:Full equals Chorismatase n=1 Tax=Streptomyces rapamycinicus (strain ATCC 29253 / DSM 41530 / NRRL 5491 / AYB-994) TaxID=1343740 RepID=A0A3L8RCF5_STRRN|nr:Full equals Chorismatase [Streptomyces rapamycinicus NRRL 5491]BCH36737.1 pteridine-dependent dioxygenase [Streptomyces rapamycinicus NRRL 5491]
MRQLTPPVTAPYCRFEKLGASDLDGDETLLGVIEHRTGHTGVSLAEGCPRTAVHTTTREDESFAEAWHAEGPKESGSHDGVAWARTPDYLFGVARVPEGGRYAAGTAAVYTGIFDLIGTLGYPSLARTWNYVSGINTPNADGLEVYRDFCVGRAEALDARGIDPATMPAATGIGAHGGGITCYFIAARAGDRVNMENPAVLTAHRYPQRYGPRPPVFSRATWLSPPGADDGRLFVSATAGIVGHETVHHGDVAAQCEVSLENIARVIGAENLGRHGLRRGYALADVDHLKVYVRHREDISTVRRICAERLSREATVAVLHTDIARTDLLVEIEGVVA